MSDPAATDPRARLDAAIAAVRSDVVARQREVDGIVEAARDSNADDEHDPEGATIAFEREQARAQLDLSRTRLAELDRAVERLRAGHYGVCETCRQPIAADRLIARPEARQCVACASRAAGR
ncbi:MAG: TraR/DksA family transcriptional regulator [Actinomycetota bacterium]|nr:MAG: TraR/DksA family transcriptional regulator [Actinomycetota bacterium]